MNNQARPFLGRPSNRDHRIRVTKIYLQGPITRLHLAARQKRPCDIRENIPYQRLKYPLLYKGTFKQDRVTRLSNSTVYTTLPRLNFMQQL